MLQKYTKFLLICFMYSTVLVAMGSVDSNYLHEQAVAGAKKLHLPVARIDFLTINHIEFAYRQQMCLWENLRKDAINHDKIKMIRQEETEQAKKALVRYVQYVQAIEEIKQQTY